MSLHDKLGKNPNTVPDKVNLKSGAAITINQETTALIKKALAKGASDTQIFSEFKRILEDHKAATIAAHNMNVQQRRNRFPKG